MDDNKNTPPANTPNNAGQQEDNKGGAGKTLTQEEHQAELDRIAGKTREEERLKSEKAVQEAVQKALEEERRQSKLSSEQREKELKEKQQKELADRELKITLRENKATAIEKFAESKLPIKLVDLVVDADASVQTEKIESFTKSWNEALELAVADRLKGDAPTDTTVPNSNNGKPTENLKPNNFI